MTVHTPKPDLPPPSDVVGPIHWMKENLFDSPLNAVLTLAAAYFIVTFGYWVLDWAVLTADFSGDSKAACQSGGACWTFVNVRFSQFIYGFYPEAERWRIDIVFAVFAVLIALLVYEGTPKRGWISLFTLTLFPLIVYYLLHGGSFGLETVETHKWGGLMLTLVLSCVGIVASLPFGILLALGRRSDMPLIRSLSTVYIEFWRGVPLITVLFMASVMLPLFMEEGVDFDKLARAMIGIIMFEAAYMAEVIRGGLQAIPKGQYEAAEALGLSYWKSMTFIIMPQALKLMIPGIVSTFIALFKDTSLVLIIGLFDLLQMVQSAIIDPAWPKVSTEGYVFAAAMFWVFCFSMSRYSQFLERKLNTGHRS